MDYCTLSDIPVDLSLCGAASLSHEAVGAILMLPLLTGLDISGCRLPAMDKMRLVSKVVYPFLHWHNASRTIVSFIPPIPLGQLQAWGKLLALITKNCIS